MGILEVVDETILTSDWHVLHRNIYWFLPEQRSRLSGAENPKSLSDEQFVVAERVLYNRILHEVERVVSAGGITRFILLGDLIFGLNKHGGLGHKIDFLRDELPQIGEIFAFLKESGVQRILLLGNHDDFKLGNARARSLYEALFDEITYYLHEDETLYTHFPLGYSIARDKTLGTEDEKFYRMHKTFQKLDRKLLEAIGEKPVVNYHGHIHQGPFPFALPNVQYKNVAIDASGDASSNASSFLQELTRATDDRLDHI
ncbi:MAG: hypothetical protein MJE77_25075 [Proteobacteria bacterium]|nr:hypothetical protein [Pseudomonadota bacterium]